LQVCDERINLSVATSHQTENGELTKVSSVERAAYAFIPQTPIRSTDAHLEEFSEAMRSNNA
jgi:NAD+ kinase